MRQLTCFLAVADERHVTKAAQKLGIQQAPLSQQIRTLEEALGVQLFVRKPRGMELTAAGHVFEREVRVLLAGLDEAVLQARAVERGDIGTLRLGVTTSAWVHPVTARVLKRLGRARPGVRLQIKQAGSPELLAAIRAGELDAGMVRGSLKAAGLQITALAHESMWLAVPRDQPAMVRAGKVQLNELMDRDFIGYPRAPGEGLYEEVIAACERRGFTPRFRFEAPQMVSALAMVAAGLGITVVPDAAAHAIRLRGMTYQELKPGEIAPAALSLALPRTQRLDAPVRELQQIALEEASR